MRKARLTAPWTVSGRAVAVPGCWEDAGIGKEEPGPFDYQTTFVVPELGPGDRVWLRFGAVSYACTIFVDGHRVGGHVGMWDAFDVEITSVVSAGAECDLVVRVEKPASLTAGPDSAAVRGTYPLRETLAGFLPYVWGHAHGGLWQDVELVVTGSVVFADVTAWGTPDGELTVEATVGGAGLVRLSVTDPSGTVVVEEEQHAEGYTRFDVTVPDPRPWSVDEPQLYTAHVSLRSAAGAAAGHRPVTSVADERTLGVGLRSVDAEGSTLLLNGTPVYPRMMLSWGWYPDLFHPAPSPDRVRADLRGLRELGFNGVKLCLWFPPTYYLDIADELGMLVWVELPMWMPHPTEHFRAQLTVESDRLVRVARDHPSVILYTLGCELTAVVGDDVLGPLYAHVKALVRDALVRDNSGSGEAYGGLLTEYADFYDHHLYCELHHFPETLEHFAPGTRDEKPWLFGEFCDLDTFRDLRRLGEQPAARPWWTSADASVNPQGARWQYDLPAQEEHLRTNGFWDRGSELETISYAQALLHRKVSLEAVRLRRDTSGYVITGERDTPISTAGLWDDIGRLKVDAASFRAFNTDLVLGLDWDRRREWVAGGDRPAFHDPWCHESGAVVRPHVVLAHHGRERAPVQFEWTVALDGEDPFVSGHCGPGHAVRPGTVRELDVAEFTVPELVRPRQATMQVRASVGTQLTTNSWRFWFFPSSCWSDVEAFVLDDPGGRLAGLDSLVPRVAEAGSDAGIPSGRHGAGIVVVATRWTADLVAFVTSGGRAILLADAASDSPVPLRPMPFWREAVKVIEPHEAWGDFPHAGWVDLQFAGCATDRALDTATMSGRMRPLLRRVDARTSEVHDYAIELGWGAGRMIASTLRFEGSRGNQPRGVARNTGAAYLLSRWIRWLQRS